MDTPVSACATEPGHRALLLANAKKVDQDIHSRLQQAIASLDVTVSHAEQAADLAEPFYGKSCSENVLTELRTLVATIPDVRTVNLGKDNEIYCTSVLAGVNFSSIVASIRMALCAC